MNLTIPFRAAASGSPGTRLRIPLRLFGNSAEGTTSDGSAAQRQTLRAVAAAATAVSVTGAVEIASEAKENPGDVVRRVDDAAIAPVLRAVVAVIEDRSGASNASEKLTKVSRAIGADPQLAAAAAAEIKDNDALARQCLDWVGSVDLALLERAATIGRGRLIDKVPKTQSRTRVEESVKELTKQLAAVEKQIKDAVTDVGRRLEKLDEDLKKMGTRLEKVENKVKP